MNKSKQNVTGKRPPIGAVTGGKRKKKAGQ